jgi:transcriptional regulator with XRE-family HTH domain
VTGAEFKAARHQLGLTVTELAERLRFKMPNGRTFVREMETGKREVSGPVSVAVELMLERNDDGIESVCAICGTATDCNCRDEFPHGADG